MNAPIAPAEFGHRPIACGPWTPFDLPPESPLAMPVQSFATAPPLSAFASSDSRLAWRRGGLLGGAAFIGVLASCGIAEPLARNGFDLIDQLLVLLSLALFAWLGIGLLTAAAGFVSLVHDRSDELPAPPRLPRERVAVLVPIHHEEVDALAARLARMGDELANLGAAPVFDFFVLSDSDAAAELAERRMCEAVRAAGRPALFYRRRPSNIGRKSGNVAEWITRFGGAYPYMLVLDADSRMSGAAMLRMAAMLEEDAALALVQSAPLLTGARTLFARWQQFTAALNGPVATAGLAWWSGDEATYWGHNAMLRTRAFAESCGLPELSGPEPLGGAIQSHDMVEAALLRRRGWRARLLPLDEGSYEESPPTLVDHALRDRRWCQGNLQHLRLLDAEGFHWISRLQLLMGASAYLTSPLWLLALAGGLFVAIRSGTPMADLAPPGWLIGLTLLLLFGPRLLALVWLTIDRRAAERLGGWRSILLSAFADAFIAVLIAPTIMASQCQSIAEIAAGRPSGWRPQRRQSSGLRFGEALDRYRWHMLIGLVFWTVSLSELGGGLWNLPVALGLLGAPLLAQITSRADLGEALARARIFAGDPAEHDPIAAPADTRAKPNLWGIKISPAVG